MSRHCTQHHFWECSWPPDQTGGMLTSQEANNAGGYNEVVISSNAWEAALPGLIEAVVYVGRGGASRAREVHEKYLAHYGRTAAQTPLVHFTGHTFEDVS